MGATANKKIPKPQKNLRYFIKHTWHLILICGISLSVIDIGFSKISWSYVGLSFDLTLRGAVTLGIAALILSAIPFFVVYVFFFLWRFLRAWYWGTSYFGYSPGSDLYENGYPKPSYLGFPVDGERNEYKKSKFNLKLPLWINLSLIAIWPSVVSVTLVGISTTLPFWSVILLCNFPLAVLVSAITSIPGKISSLGREADARENEDVKDYEKFCAEEDEKWYEILKSEWW